MDEAKMKSAAPILASLDIPTTVRFYTETLGFSCRFQAVGEYAILQRDDIEIHFWCCADPNIAANTACRVEVTGIDSLYNEYSSRKALRHDAALEEKPWQTREFEVFDPHSNLITFFERTTHAV